MTNDLGDTKAGFYIRTFWYAAFFVMCGLQVYSSVVGIDFLTNLSLSIPIWLSGIVFYSMGVWKRRKIK
jgi:uncharacterized membrane protein